MELYQIEQGQQFISMTAINFLKIGLLIALYFTLFQYQSYSQKHGGGWTISQNVSSLALRVWDGQCREDIKRKDDSKGFQPFRSPSIREDGPIAFWPLFLCSCSRSKEKVNLFLAFTTAPASLCRMAPSSLCTAPSSVCKSAAVVNVEFPSFWGTKVLI